MRSAGLAGFLILLLGALLRLLWIDAGWFGVDQARDLAWAEAIVSGRSLPLVGPLMRGQVHLGATYYYFWAIPALVGDDPRIAYAFAALLGVAAIAGTFALGRRVSGRGAGLLAALLLASTPAAVIDSRIAWAPAVLPPLSALVLLLSHAFLRRPTVARGATLAASTTLATQLHLAAAPLALVAAVCILARARPLGPRGLFTAALAGAVPLLPMALAFGIASGIDGPRLGDVVDPMRREVATRPTTSPAGDPTRGRVSDMVAIGGRIIAAYTPPRAERRPLFSLWSSLETLALPIAFLGAVVVGAGSAGRRTGKATDSPLLEWIAFVLAIGAVFFLPAEAWYYYLDVALVPGCVLLGVAATRPGRLARGLRLVLLAAVALRVTGLLLWIGDAHREGVLRVNLELLRLGGSDSSAFEGRARLPTLAVKQKAARILIGDLGLSPSTIRERAHGPGFADLDSDNGFLFGRAAAAKPFSAAPRSRTSDHALVVYAGELPEAWAPAAAPMQRAGPLEIRHYAPVLRMDAARILDCDGRAEPLPKPLWIDPREYGFGEPVYPAWPCSPGEIRVEVPIDRRETATPVRAFARTAGDASVRSLETEPPGVPIDPSPPGYGPGLLLPMEARTLRLRMQIEGPATLDLFELHGLAEDGSLR